MSEDYEREDLEREIARVRRESAVLTDEIEALRNRLDESCLLYTSPSPRDATLSRMPSSA